MRGLGQAKAFAIDKPQGRPGAGAGIQKIIRDPAAFGGACELAQGKASLFQKGSALGAAFSLFLGMRQFLPLHQPEG